MQYNMGEMILVRGKVTRRIEEEGNVPMYRVKLNVGGGTSIDVLESDVAGSVMNIAKLNEEDDK